VRVSQSLCPLTSILSPRGERRYIRCYFQANCMNTKNLEEIFQISPIIPSPFDACLREAASAKAGGRVRVGEDKSDLVHN